MGSAPTGKAAPRPLVTPGGLGTVTAEPPTAGLPVVEPGAAAGFVLVAGLGDAGTVATVTVGALALPVSGAPFPLATETLAENRIDSPAGAVFGTLTCAWIWGEAGCSGGRVSSTLGLPVRQVQPAIVTIGWPNVGVFALGVSMVAIVPASVEAAQPEIRNTTVSPGCTLVADAETVTEGLAGVDVEGAEVPERAGPGVAGDDEGEGADEELCRGPAAHPGDEAAGRLVPLGTGADGVTAGPDDSAGLDGAAGVVVAAGGPGT